MVDLQIRQVPSTHNDLVHLIGELDEYLLQRYPSEEVFGVDFSDPELVFVIAYKDELAIGCGAIRPLDEQNTELKRFFVAEEFRKLGVAKSILEVLENKARDLSYTHIKLEAGEAQPEALRFYEKHGYNRIDRYGEYVNSESSVCYGKRL